MKGTMKVAVMNGIGKMGYTTRPIPTPKEDEVLVKLEYVGICGSDMHYYETRSAIMWSSHRSCWATSRAAQSWKLAVLSSI